MKSKLSMIMVFAIVLMLGCSKKEIEDATDETIVASAGTADITLKAGNSTFKLIGSCGWAVAANVKYIGAKHTDNNLRVFSANFSIDELPTKTTTYTLVESNANDKDVTHVSMSITQLTGNKLFSYVSSNTSGKLTLVVDGNKVTANLSGITLQPTILTDIQKLMYTSENVGDFANAGALSGTLTLYRK